MGRAIAKKLAKQEAEIIPFVQTLSHSGRKTKKSVSDVPRYFQLISILNLSGWLLSVVRDPKDFVCRTVNAFREKRDFLLHCFGKYFIPAHLYRAWGLLFENYQSGYEPWLVCVGRGGSLYRDTTAGNFMTKREIHMFLTKSNPDWSIQDNILRAKALCAGLSEKNIIKLQRSLSFSNLDLSNDYWKKALVFFFKYAEEIESSAAVHDVMDFILNAFPLFDGRTWSSLLRLSNDWHREFARSKHGKNFVEWVGLGLLPWKKTYKYLNDKFDCGPNGKYEWTWEIVELRNTEELYEEGSKMRHCVSGYDVRCQKGLSSIFSVRYYQQFQPTKPIRAATVEVSGRMIVQARGRFNKDLILREKQVVRKWAALNGFLYRT